MKQQKQILDTIKWDVLIVLDACRYDTFNKVFKCFKNSITPVNSGASCTFEWLCNTWKWKYKDIDYVSGNPFINTLSYSVDKQYPFVAKYHFGKVYNAWNNVDKLGRSRPETVTKIALQKLGNSPRMIVHYLQPHAPYVFVRKPKKNVVDICKKYIPNTILQKVYKHLPYSLKVNMTPEMRLAEYYSPYEIKQAYERNLRSIVGEILLLTETLDAVGYKWIITSDHAEYLGEQGKWGHGGEHNAVITTVPLVVG